MSTLAYFGAAPVIGSSDHSPYPSVGDRERVLVNEALDSHQLWAPWAPFSRRLEDSWAARVGVRYCSLLSSGTAALHCAYVGCGVRPGDEVIVPAYTFVATASSAMMAGAVPVFADVERATGNLDPNRVEELITARTVAIGVAHIHGQPADMDALVAISERYGLQVIEDCAQAHGATYKGRPVGSLGTAAAFSLNATKLLAGAEGGLFSTDSAEVFNQAGRIRVFGPEIRDGDRLYRDTDAFGFNYRSNELSAAFALARLESFDREAIDRRANARRLIDGLRGLAGVRVPPEVDGAANVFQMVRIEVDAYEAGVDLPPDVFRHRVMAALNAEGARWWVWERRPLPAYAIFQTRNAEGRGVPWSYTAEHAEMRYEIDSYPSSAAITERSLYTTAHYPPNALSLMDKYVEAFRRVWDSLDDVAAIELEPPPLGYTEPFA